MGFVPLKYLPAILPHMGDQSGFYRLVWFPILFGHFEMKGGEFQIIHGEFQMKVRLIFVQGGQWNNCAIHPVLGISFQFL